MKIKYRHKLKKWMKNKIPFRLHMSIIMFSTIFLGMISNFIMLNTIGVTHPALRYPLTVIFSYLWFLLFIRIYIRNILVSPSSFSVADLVSPDLGTSHGAIPVQNSSWSDGGGSFNGGGSSGDWSEGEIVAEASGEVVGSSVASIVDDEGGAVVAIVFGGIIAALVFGTGAYFIWYSPEILSECLIQVILVSGMRKRMKKFSEAEWITHMFKVTRWPFIFVLVFSIVLGFTLRGLCSEAHQLRDYRTQCWKG